MDVNLLVLELHVKKLEQSSIYFCNNKQAKIDLTIISTSAAGFFFFFWGEHSNIKSTDVDTI